MTLTTEQLDEIETEARRAMGLHLSVEPEPAVTMRADAALSLVSQARQLEQLAVFLMAKPGDRMLPPDEAHPAGRGAVEMASDYIELLEAKLAAQDLPPVTPVEAEPFLPAGYAVMAKDTHDWSWNNSHGETGTGYPTRTRAINAAHLHAQGRAGG